MTIQHTSLQKLLFGLIFLLTIKATMAQNQPHNNDFWNNVHFGGGIGLGFTNGGFNGSISPSAIYQVSQQFATGVGLNFNYAKFNDNKFLAYGGSVLALYNPIPYLQFSGELEQLRVNREIPTMAGTIEDNYWSPALFLGVGYSNQHVTIGIRYDLLYDDNKSIYANAWMPFVRVYF